jgi:hypothetical protein
MIERFKPIPLVFWKSAAGREPVRDWLNELPREDQRIIGRDIAKVHSAGLLVCQCATHSEMGFGKCVRHCRAAAKGAYCSASMAAC